MSDGQPVQVPMDSQGLQLTGEGGGKKWLKSVPEVPGRTLSGGRSPGCRSAVRSPSAPWRWSASTSTVRLPHTTGRSKLTERSHTMGDKGGKKEKNKAEKQKVAKQDQQSKKKQKKQEKSTQ
jgi:hypothetical protein